MQIVVLITHLTIYINTYKAFINMNTVSQLVGNLANNMAEHGCSVFFFTSAIQSGIFGEISRHNQAELTEKNLEFRERLQEIKDEFQRERIDAQLRYRRESYELSRQYMLQQSAMINENRQREIEFQVFLENYWPLNYSPFSVITEQKKLLQRSIVPLRVIIAKTEVSQFERTRPDSSYGQFCQDIKIGLQNIGNISVEIRPWKNACQSSICEAMNVNYIMQGIPTLILFPYQIGDTFGIEMSAWAFLSGNRSMMQNKVLTIDGYKGVDNLENTYSAVRSVIGMARDAYMLSEYRMPVCFPEIAKNDKAMLPETRKMLFTHYENLQRLVESNDEYKQLCSQGEIDQIKKSLESNKITKE